MEHNYDLLRPKAGAKDKRGKIKRKSMRRLMAMLLSAVLAAGTCLPAIAVETTQTEEAGVAASTDTEQAAEVQPEEGGNEAVTEGSSEGTSSEVTGSNEETGGQTADPANDNSGNAVAADSGDSNDNADDSDEIAGEAVTSDAAEIAAEEEPKAAADTDGTDPSGASAGGNLQNTQGDSSWLNDYTYEIIETYEGLARVCLTHYNGADTEIEVPGTVEVEGVTYPVTMRGDGDIWDNSVESLTFGEGFIFPQNCSYLFSGKTSLTSIDLSLADMSEVTSVRNMFSNCSSIEELDLSSFSPDEPITCVDEMFYGCSNLRSLNLGGWYWSSVESASDVFEGCSSLEEFVTPGYALWYVEIELPHLMADQDGNIYSKLPTETDSKTLTSFEYPQWLDDYDFSVSSEESTINLYSYHGSASAITMPGSLELAGKEYQMKVLIDTWGSGVTSITFEGSDPFGYDANSSFFEWIPDLEVLDLRSVNCTYLNYMQFDGCKKLKTIYLPANCEWHSQLPGVFKDETGNHYSELPELSNSIRLDAVTCDEWLEDFTYSIIENGIELTGYYGNKTDLVIPGSAVIDGETYNGVLITHNIWTPDYEASGIKNLKFGNGVRTGALTPSGYEIQYMFEGESDLESFDGSELGGFKVSYAYGLFSGCTNLRTVDLSGYDFSNCHSASGLFEGCDSLETIETPVNVNISVELPGPFIDEDGNIYTELPKNLNESITLTKADASGWLKDYRFEVTDDSIILLEFTGWFETIYDNETGEYTTDRRLTVPGSAYIGEKTYKVVLSKDIWERSDVQELYFEQGVYLPEDCSDLFQYDSLEKIDLSGLNVTEAADMRTMLTGCKNLTTIVVPKGVSLDSYLPGLFVDENGNNYISLPTNVSESFTITKTDTDGWLSDYDFYIAGNKIVLTGYHGNASDLTVPGSAVIGNTNYAIVEITPEIDWGETETVRHLSFANGVVVPEDCSGLFDTYGPVSIDMSNIDTSHVTNMSNMFSCYSLEELNLSGFDTSSATNMHEMFAYTSLTELDLSGFDTSKVTDMSGMFSDLQMTELDISGFDTSKVTDMSAMFEYCSNLTSLNLSGFDTSKVTNMSEMFENCSNLTSLDLKAFNTSNVTDMSWMFRNCSNLTSLDVSGFDTTNVVDMRYMFFNCRKLTVLDVSGFNTEKVTSIAYMFNNCRNVLELDLSSWKLTSLTNAHRVLNGTIPVIKAPVNLTANVELLANYTGSDGLMYTSLPQNASTSILLTWASASGDPGGNTSGDPSGTCNHVYGEWVVTKEATCTEDGSREKVCTICGDKVTETINANGHQWNEAYTTDKEATCTEDGSESHHCLVCDAIDETTAVVIPAKGHAMTRTAGKDATCTEDGNTEYWTCSRCNKLFSDASGSEETTLEATVIPAKGHVWAENYTVDREATCTEEGSESIHCSICDEIKEGSSHVIPIKDHAYGEWKVIVKATCTSDGSKERVCANCGDKETETVPATGHVWNKEYTVDKEATCTEVGYESIHCSVCGIFDESTVREIPVNADNHTYGDWVVTQAATCTEAGSKEKTCTGCGNKVTEEIPAAGHKWNSYYTIDKNPTSSAEGSKSKHCSVCNEKNPSTVQSIPRLTGTWKKDSKGWWYSWSDGSYSKNKFENFGGKVYYFNSSGYMVTGWQAIGGKWYYFDANGVMKTGWQSIGGKWYYFDGSGAMKTGWLSISGKWYYMNGSGVMQTGWQSIGGKWYYFDGSGVMAANKWIGDYYVTGSGAMATNTWIGNYYVGADGKWIPGYKAAN